MRERAVVVVLLVGSALAAAGCERSARSADAPALDVAAAPVRVAAIGRVEGWREADVASKLPGRILRFEFEEGSRVEEGTTVVRLEDQDLRIRVRREEARARETRRALERVRALRARGVTSVSELEHAESEYQTSAAALDEARVMLAYASIDAPFGGTVVRRYKEMGESVTTSSQPDPLFRIADLSRLKVTAEVPEGDIGRVRDGQVAWVTLDAYPGERFEASVLRIGLAVGRKRLHSDDPRERIHDKVIEVELELPSDARLKSGMTVDVTFPL